MANTYQVIDGAVNIKTPDGQIGSLPEKEALGLIQEGKAVAASQQEVNEYLTAQEIRQEVKDSPGAAYVDSLVSGLTFGISDIDEDPERLKARREEHPWLSAAGEITSFLLPFGPVGLAGKAIRGIQAASTVGKIGRAGAALATEGALIGAQQGVVQQAEQGGDITPQGVLEGAAVGAAANVGTGAVLGTLGKVASKAWKWKAGKVEQYIKRTREEQMALTKGTGKVKGQQLEMFERAETSAAARAGEELAAATPLFPRVKHLTNAFGVEMLTGGASAFNAGLGAEALALNAIGNYITRLAFKFPIPEAAASVFNKVIKPGVSLAASMGTPRLVLDKQDKEELRASLDTEGTTELVNAFKQADKLGQLDTAVNYAVNPLTLLDDVSNKNLFTSPGRMEIAAILQPELFAVVKATIEGLPAVQKQDRQFTKSIEQHPISMMPTEGTSLSSATVGKELAKVMKESGTLDTLFNANSIFSEDRTLDHRRALGKEINKFPEQSVPMVQQIRQLIESNQEIPPELSGQLDSMVRDQTGITNATQKVVNFSLIKANPSNPISSLPLFTNFEDAASKSLQGKATEHMARAFIEEHTYEKTIRKEVKSSFTNFLPKQSKVKILSPKEEKAIKDRLDSLDEGALMALQQEEIEAFGVNRPQQEAIESSRVKVQQIRMLREKSYLPITRVEFSNYVNACSDPRTILVRIKKGTSTPEDVEVFNSLYPEAGRMISVMARDALDTHSEKVQEGKGRLKRKQVELLRMWTEPTQEEVVIASTAVPAPSRKQQSLNLNLNTTKADTPLSRAVNNIG